MEIASNHPAARSSGRSTFASRLNDLLTFLPRGNTLPPDVWLTRHHAILWLVWIQAGCLFAFTLVQGYDVTHALLESSAIVALPALVEGFRLRNQTLRATAASFGLISSAAVLTHLSGGYIEAHFHFFVMLAVIALYQSWVPFLISILYVLIHHGVAGAIDPGSVFNHSDAFKHPFKWAAIHAAFVSAACASYMVAWRWNEIAQAQSRHILNAAGEGIIGLDPDGHIQFVNPQAVRIAGRSAESMLGQPLESVLPFKALAGQEGSLAGPDATLTTAPEHTPIEGLIDRNRAVLPVEIVRTVILDRNKVSGGVITLRDISSRKDAERAVRENEQRFRSLVQNASDMITVIEMDTTVRYQSPSIERVLGYNADEMVGQKFLALFHPEDVAPVVAFLGDAMARPNHSAAVEARVAHRDGSYHDLEIIGTDQRADASVQGFVLNIRDVSERKALERELRHQAFHDSLTDLANRASFLDRLEHALERSKKNKVGLSVIFMDLDDFKSMNDSFGHDAGDEVLIEVARRIQACLPPGDTAARLGGDEFAVLLEDVPSETYARQIASRLLASLALPYVRDKKEFTITASLGIAGVGSVETTAGELVRNADIAMYEAKRNGGSRFALYTPDMYALTLERLELLADLQRAVTRNEFEVRYQPTVRLQSGRIVGFEALVRWHHPVRGMLLPAQFIGLAEESAAILPLGRWVLMQACKQAKQWQEQFGGEPALTMNVNVSVYQLQSPSFVDDVKEALRVSGFAPGNLILEVTESVMMQNTGAMIARLNEVKELGVRLAIDDFGTGYSSLSYLRQFPFDILKVDKAFIDTDKDPGQKDLARAIIELGKTLRLEIVAEGIERVDQLETLQGLDCEFGQGYYFSKPLEALQIAELLTQGRGQLHAA